MNTQETQGTSQLPKQRSVIDCSLSIRHPPLDLLRSIITAAGEHRISVVVTGAGIDLISDLTRVPGASAKFIGGHIPYDKTQVTQLLGYAPTHSVSEETAIGLAQSAYFSAQRSAVLNKDFEGSNPPTVIGLGLTGAVTSSRDRRGDDHIWIAVRTTKGVEIGHFMFEKGSGDSARASQNEIAGMIALNILATKVGTSQILGELPEVMTTKVGQCSSKALTLRPAGISATNFLEPTLILPDGRTGDIQEITTNNILIYPGSFRSFHCGHDLAAENAARISGKKVIFEISATNADKAAIDGVELARRATQFLGRYPVIITPNSPLFIDKSLSYPKGTGFVTGYDTAERLLDPKYYKSENDLLAALKLFRERGNIFYVLGRSSMGSFKTILDLPEYEKNRDLFHQITGQLDISATALQRV